MQRNVAREGKERIERASGILVEVQSRNGKKKTRVC